MGAKLKYNFGLIIVSDEELGSKFGMEKLMHENLFNKDDMFLVPDFWSDKGDILEIGEKGMLWLKITVKGKQVHASTPEMGKNAFRYSIKFLNEADEYLHLKYSLKNKLFEPSISTFEMTKHEKNVDSINIVPGLDVSYIDCRILPEYNSEQVIADLQEITKKKEFSEVQITIEPSLKDDPAEPTLPNAEIVKLLENAVHKLNGIHARKIGIGGGTCALFPRRYNMQAVVWCTGPEIAHQANEYTIIKNMVSDAKVMAYLFL